MGDIDAHAPIYGSPEALGRGKHARAWVTLVALRPSPGPCAMRNPLILCPRPRKILADTILGGLEGRWTGGGAPGGRTAAEK